MRWRCSSSAQRDYLPVSYAGRIAYFESSDTRGHLDPHIMWGPLALGAFTVHRVPGDHDSMMLVPTNAEMLARELRTVLDEAELEGEQ
jgi:hypothetical protein